MMTRLITSRYCTYFLAAIAFIIVAADYLTGRDIRFPVLYVIPVGLAAWGNRINFAYTLAILLPITRLSFHVFWPQATFPLSAIFNALLRIAVLLACAYFLNQAREATNLRKRVSTLEGILPMCASCKKIMNEKGVYEPVETYISNHSKAEFSHGICPDCIKKLYPEYADRILHDDKKS
ncbi:MAG: hypothetical protein E4H27_07675 [Anaerolineales bacterium]|nr:MAG: hypothetical protein E4H27_07675 [Anaerolineales bacterium]